MSVSSLAITTTGTGVAVFAVLGLKTSVLVILYDEGTAAEVDAGAPARAAFQLAGSRAAAWTREPLGSMERAARADNVFSSDIGCGRGRGRADEWLERMGRVGQGCRSAYFRYFGSSFSPDSNTRFLAQFAVVDAVDLILDAHSRPT